MSDPPSARSPAATLLLPRFVARRRQDVEQVRDALARGDFEVIARIGHNMRGNGRSYGFPDLGVIGERMEAAAESADTAAIQMALQSLESCLARIRIPGSGSPAP